MSDRRTAIRPMCIALAAAAALLAALAAGCNGGDSENAAPRVTLQLNWKPEPQFGGFYAAGLIGAYDQQGLEVTVVPGGAAGAPTIDMVGAGTVPFAIVSGDEIVVARTRGNNVVALFAVYQTNPQGILTHAARGFEQIGDVFAHEGTLAMERGLPYASFLERKYGFGKLRIVPSPFGDLSVFRSDPNYSAQCFVTSEPLAAERLGLKVKTFLIADSGYNPYTTVLATSEQYLAEHREQCMAMVRAVRRGWEAYLVDPEPANQTMRQLNPTMDAQTFTDSAAAQKPLIETEKTRQSGVGVMTAERWQTLVDQLLELKVIEKPVDASRIFVAQP